MPNGLLYRCAVVALFCTPAVWAGVPAPERTVPDIFELSLEELLLVKVSTTTRYAESVWQTPGHAVVVTADQIRRRGYRNLAQLLAALPSTEVLVGAEVFESVRIGVRGVIGNNKFIILQDGIRLSSPTTDLVTVADNYPLLHVRQVEVVYGPASALYGADAFTGVINLITRTGSEQPGSELQAMSGNDGARAIGVQHHAAFAGGATLALALTRTERDGTALADEYPETFRLGDLLRFDGSVAVPVAERAGFRAPSVAQTVFARLLWSEQVEAGFSQLNDRHSPVIGEEVNHVDYGANPTWDTTLSSAYLRSRWSPGAIGQWEAELGWQHYLVDPASRFNNRFSDFFDGYKYAESTKHYANLRLDLPISDGSRWLMGVGYEDYEVVPETYDLTQPYDPDRPAHEQAFYYIGSNDSLPVDIFAHRYDNRFAFVQWQQRLSEQITATLGLRHDQFSTFGGTTNPRLGLVWQPDDRSSLKLLYGTAFLAPSPKLRFAHFGAFSFQRPDGLYHSFFFHIANPDLKPEQLRMTELHYDRLMSARWKLSASIFQQAVRDVILVTPTATPVTDFIPGGFIEFTEHNANVGSIDSHGLELVTEYQRESWSLWASYSYLDGNGEFGTTRVAIPFTSSNKIKAGLTWVTGDWQLSPALQWIGERSGAETTEPGRSVPAYTVLDVTARYVMSSQGELALTVGNLLDDTYYHPGRGLTGAMFEVPQEGRRWQLGFSWRF